MRVRDIRKPLMGATAAVLLSAVAVPGMVQASAASKAPTGTHIFFGNTKDNDYVSGTACYTTADGADGALVRMHIEITTVPKSHNHASVEVLSATHDVLVDQSEHSQKYLISYPAYSGDSVVPVEGNKGNTNYWFLGVKGGGYISASTVVHC